MTYFGGAGRAVRPRCPRKAVAHTRSFRLGKRQWKWRLRPGEVPGGARAEDSPKPRTCRRAWMTEQEIRDRQALEAFRLGVLGICSEFRPQATMMPSVAGSGETVPGRSHRNRKSRPGFPNFQQARLRPITQVRERSRPRSERADLIPQRARRNRSIGSGRPLWKFSEPPWRRATADGRADYSGPRCSREWFRASKAAPSQARRLWRVRRVRPPVEWGSPAG